MNSKARIEVLEALLAEAYVVVGVLLEETGEFDTEHGQKILDNLASMELQHNDVIPWPERYLTVTKNADTGEAIAVTWQDHEHRVLRTVWSKE